MMRPIADAALPMKTGNQAAGSSPNFARSASSSATVSVRPDSTLIMSGMPARLNLTITLSRPCFDQKGAALEGRSRIRRLPDPRGGRLADSSSSALGLRKKMVN